MGAVLRFDCLIGLLALCNGWYITNTIDLHENPFGSVLVLASFVVNMVVFQDGCVQIQVDKSHRSPWGILEYHPEYHVNL